MSVSLKSRNQLANIEQEVQHNQRNEKIVFYDNSAGNSADEINFHLTQRQIENGWFQNN